MNFPTSSFSLSDSVRRDWHSRVFITTFVHLFIVDHVLPRLFKFMQRFERLHQLFLFFIRPTFLAPPRIIFEVGFRPELLILTLAAKTDHRVARRISRRSSCDGIGELWSCTHFLIPSTFILITHVEVLVGINRLLLGFSQELQVVWLSHNLRTTLPIIAVATTPFSTASTVTFHALQHLPPHHRSS